ncbi:hypothetical protein Dimus_020163 [Dionaea muscipula]
MADCDGHRKRRSEGGKKKLLVGEKVEVRNLEDGFLGSWHPGTIIGCGHGTRHVRYDHLLSDEGSGYLAEYVGVSSHIDGNYDDSGLESNSHGRIRPFPPVMESEKRFQFGLCVDAYHNDAWWEGVVFNQEDNLEEREVFFPGIGDELMVKNEDLRISHDWNEITEEWVPRGKWLLLEIFEEYEQENLIPISAKQIWYDVRGSGKFAQVGEWTFPGKSIWQELITEALSVYTKLLLDAFVKSFDFLEDEIQKTEPACSIDCNFSLESKRATEEEVKNGISTKDIFPSCPSSVIVVSSNSQGMVAVPQVLPVAPHASCSKKRRRRSSKAISWHPACPDIVPGAEFCPGSINDYTHVKKASYDVVTNLRKHLLYCGFKIDYTMDGSIPRLRYTSPCGKVYNSLRPLCRDKMELGLEDFCPTSVRVEESLVLSPVSETPSSTITVDAEYCPEAVIEYLRVKGSCSRLQDQARKHLSSMGWSFWFKTEKDKFVWRYTSPEKKTYSSLYKACAGFVAGGLITNTLSICDPMEDVPCSKDLLKQGNVVQKQPQEHNSLTKLGNHPREKFRKRKTPSTSCLSKPRALEKSRKRWHGNCPERVLQPSKRAREVLSINLSHPNPRSILSWLIDNNVVLPMATVYYRIQKDRPPMAEGRITRDGIKCSCCEKLFSITNFEVHAGSSRRKPSASIFVEDGRSLIECQMETMCDSHEGFSRDWLGWGRKNRHKKSKNDYICSVCHYGGKLILCDQCPSSFHASCLNLQDIPEGDWFCPSCCCGICLKCQFDENSGQFMDEGVIFCHQCERLNHVGCLRDRGMITADVPPKGSRFCSKTCEKIFYGLQELIGQRILVGLEDLTWTLIKPIEYESDHMDDSNTDIVTENYKKLNLAVELMHECFEPVIETWTNRDLMEDVIFSRGSELNRLNFRGFYTVLLERNEEMISVATIRVYGEKVAEVPLVGTRIQYRRLGMCRVLMHELEKRLFELGVERLILPAVPSVLNTWTTAFGFSQMTKSERSEFFTYTFLDFQGTVMCQKLLRKLPSCTLRKLRDILREPCENGSGSKSKIEFEGNSAMPEVFQEEEIERSESVDQGAVEVNYKGAINKLACPVPERHLSYGQYCPQVKGTTNQGPEPTQDSSGDRSLESMEKRV